MIDEMDIDYKRVPPPAGAWAEEIYWLTASWKSITEMARGVRNAEEFDPFAKAIVDRLRILLNIEGDPTCQLNIFHRPTTVADDGRYMLVRKADNEAEANEWITSQPNPQDFYFVPVAAPDQNA